MKYEDDGQFELLSQLLNNEQSGQSSEYGTTGIEQEHELHGAKGFAQRSQPVAHPGVSSQVETRPDPGRERRKGAPEVVFGETKEVAQIIAMAQGLLAGSGRAIISRIRADAFAEIQQHFREYNVRTREAARAMVIYAPEYVRRSTGGHIGVISAGTSDIPVAEEATLIAEEMGCRVTCIYDVGVAGLHRLITPLHDLLVDEVDAIIVAAGMDGALPSVVAGLVPVPVVGLPTSIGYGLGGRGIAALLSMLQTCAPGLSVVNIDNGVGAGITAALIANRVAQAREHQSQ
ncbi:MAG TPA: nickel pincer cofactor biosynthesis protein LarB [Ktedonobacteraceae bacterium]|nr:nickel pincer cofactor biosynthesis protein LarB [Ktedonobacteraceae bacterium]